MYRRLLILGVLCILSNIVYTSDTNYRLNTPIVPSAYDILITPTFDSGDEKAFTFDGEATITFTTTASTNQIKLHSRDLNFTTADITVTNLSNQNAVIGLSEENPLEFDTFYEFAYINLAANLSTGNLYSLKITYEGPIRNDLVGFYRSFYLDNGVRKWVGATQLEATHARKVFPCFDEPSLKAVFRITLDRPSYFKKSFANTKMQAFVDLGNGYIRETFYPSPIMPTYCVAILFSDKELAQFSVNGSEEFGVFTRPDAKNQTQFSFEFGMTTLNVLSAYYDIDYYSTNPYLKLDYVSIPDFRVGAMENWGLVKYREALMLFDPVHSGPLFKYRIAQVVAHENAHLWFGNLVTCHWWSDTWLNEAFGNYFQDYTTELVEPELGAGNQMVIGTMYDAYVHDDSPSTVPISNINVNSPAEIDAHFGKISYQKGGSIVRMIHHLIEDEAFQFGLQTYLKNNSFAAGYPELVYAALNESVAIYNAFDLYDNTNIVDVMKSWINQPGHPVLNVDIDYEAETVTLTQKRFYINKTYSSDEIYKIPISYTLGNYEETTPDFEHTKPAFIMDTETHKFAIPNIGDKPSWAIFNLQESGFYRVNYDEQSWKLISEALKGSDHKTIHYLNRAKIINDLFAFLYADQADFTILHDVLKFLSEETEYSVWVAALNGFNKLRDTYVGHPDALPTIDEYFLELLSFGVERFGYTERSNDRFEDLRTRQEILLFACRLKHAGCVESAVAQFRALRVNGTEIPASLRPVVYETGLRHGTGEDYDFLWSRIMTTAVPTEVTVIGDALGHTSDPEKIRSYLVQATVENTPIKSQDVNLPLRSVLSNYTNLPIVLESLKNDFAIWTTIYPSMDSPISLIGSSLKTEIDFSEFETFLVECTLCTESAKNAGRAALEQAITSKTWADEHKEFIVETIRSNSHVSVPSIFMIILSLAIFFIRY